MQNAVGYERMIGGASWDASQDLTSLYRLCGKQQHAGSLVGAAAAWRSFGRSAYGVAQVVVWRDEFVAKDPYCRTYVETTSVRWQC